MILPFTTNQWNAIRFVTLNLISVPLIELALHRLHQLGVANRMLRGKKTRVRPSFLANWGLHQEVDELSVRSRITAFIVAFCYVAFSLYTEYASGSKQVPKKSVWEPPVLPRPLLRDKPALFDTTLMPVGPFIGCRSKKSREKLQQLLEHTVNVKVHRRLYKKIPMTLDGATVNYTRAHFENTGGEENGRIQLVLNPSVRNSYHVAFTLRKDAGYYAVVAEMHDEEVCFRLNLFNRFVCLSKSENITLSMILGNIVLFGGNLPNSFSELSYVTLPSASAFHFGCVPIEHIGKSICDAFALARTPSEFSKALSRVPQSYRDRFWLNPRFKYDFGPANTACSGTPRIEPPSLKVSAKAELSIFYDPWTRKGPLSKLYLLKVSPEQVSKSFGLFHRNLIYFEEIKFPRLHCSVEYRGYRTLQYCVQRHFNGAISLSRVNLLLWGLVKDSSAAKVSFFINWTLNWTSQDSKLSDLSRGALAYSIAAREFLGVPSLSAHNISYALKRGIPKLTQVGTSGVRYNEIAVDVERAEVCAWVLGAWGIMLLIAVNYLLFVKLSNARLFPDVYLLYCHSVMRKHTRYNNGKSIRTAPTAAMVSAKGIVNLNISYDDLSAGDVQVKDVLQ